MSRPGGHQGADQQPDDELARRAGSGDRVALEVLLRRHQLLAYRICRRLCSSEADALDALQEALVTVARRIDRFDGRSAFTTWLYRVTTNACLDELRRARRRPVPVPSEELDGARTADESGGSGSGWDSGGTGSGGTGSGGSVAGFRRLAAGRDRAAGHQPDPADRIADRLALDAALAALAPDFRSAVVLRDVAGLDYGEIAEVLSVPIGTVRSRISRGRRQLARSLQPRPPDAPGPDATGNRDHGRERRTTDRSP